MPDAICRCYPLGRRIDVPVACSTQQRDHWSAWWTWSSPARPGRQTDCCATRRLV